MSTEIKIESLRQDARIGERKPDITANEREHLTEDYTALSQLSEGQRQQLFAQLTGHESMMLRQAFGLPEVEVAGNDCVKRKTDCVKGKKDIIERELEVQIKNAPPVAECDIHGNCHP